MTLHDTIKDILKTVNTQMSEEKADMWTNVIMLAIKEKYEELEHEIYLMEKQ